MYYEVKIRIRFFSFFVYNYKFGLILKVDFVLVLLNELYQQASDPFVHSDDN